nr:unnamed protein product [Digitaria exilis]
MVHKAPEILHRHRFIWVGTSHPQDRGGLPEVAPSPGEHACAYGLLRRQEAKDVLEDAIRQGFYASTAPSAVSPGGISSNTPPPGSPSPQASTVSRNESFHREPEPSAKRGDPAPRGCAASQASSCSATVLRHHGWKTPWRPEQRPPPPPARRSPHGHLQLAVSPRPLVGALSGHLSSPFYFPPPRTAPLRSSTWLGSATTPVEHARPAWFRSGASSAGDGGG